jgi:hypothetical protein
MARVGISEYNQFKSVNSVIRKMFGGDLDISISIPILVLIYNSLVASEERTLVKSFSDQINLT